MPRRRAITSAKGRRRAAAENGYDEGTLAISICPPAPPAAPAPYVRPQFDVDLAQLNADLAKPLARIAELTPRQNAVLSLLQYSEAEGQAIIRAYQAVPLTRQPVTPQGIRALHRMLTAGLPRQDGATNTPGEFRRHQVELRPFEGGPVVFMPPPAEQVPALVAELCDWVNAQRPGVLVAVLAHLHLATIHPFGDANGRTARLLEFMLLIWAGVPAASAVDLHNAWLANRREYSDHLQAARGGDVRPLLRFAAEGLLADLSN